MNNTNKTEYTEDTITLLLDGGKEVECDILAIFPIREQFYVALMPQTPIEGYEEGEYFLYRYSSDGENVELSDIESDVFSVCKTIVSIALFIYFILSPGKSGKESQICQYYISDLSLMQYSQLRQLYSTMRAIRRRTVLFDDGFDIDYDEDESIPL